MRKANASASEMRFMEEPLTDDAIDILEGDHRRVEFLFKRFPRAQTTSERKEIIDAILRELALHTAVEEDLVYPTLADEYPERTHEALEEHHIVRLALAELADLDPDAPEARPKIKVLSEIIKHHVREEETLLLPMLKRVVYDLNEFGMLIKERKQELSKNMAKIEERKRPSEGAIKTVSGRKMSARAQAPAGRKRGKAQRRKAS